MLLIENEGHENGKKTVDLGLADLLVVFSLVECRILRTYTGLEVA